MMRPVTAGDQFRLRSYSHSFRKALGGKDDFFFLNYLCFFSHSQIRMEGDQPFDGCPRRLAGGVDMVDGRLEGARRLPAGRCSRWNRRWMPAFPERGRRWRGHGDLPGSAWSGASLPEPLGMARW